MNAWDGLVGVLQRHYTLVSSGAVKVGDTSGCLHYQSSNVMASRPSFTLDTQQDKVSNPLVATGGDLRLSREDFLPMESTSSLSNTKLTTTDETGLFRSAATDTVVTPSSERSVGTWTMDDTFTNTEMPLTFGQPQRDNRNNVLPSSLQGPERDHKNDYTQSDTCDALLMYEGGSECAV